MIVVALLGLLVKITFIFKLLADKKINQNYWQITKDKL